MNGIQVARSHDVRKQFGYASLVQHRSRSVKAGEKVLESSGPAMTCYCNCACACHVVRSPENRNS